jgi:hypothetical protein
MWALLWTLFFLVLGLKRENLTRYTGAVTLVEGVLTTIPAFMLLLGVWTGSGTTALVYAVLVVLMAVGLLPLARRRPETGAHTPAPAPRAPVASG